MTFRHFSAKGESITHYYFYLSLSKSTIQNALVHFLRNLHNLSHPNQLCLFPLPVAIAAKQCLIPPSPISADTAATANRLGAPTPNTTPTMLPSPACTAATRSKTPWPTNPKNARKTPLASPSQPNTIPRRGVRQPIHVPSFQTTSTEPSPFPTKTASNATQFRTSLSCAQYHHKPWEPHGTLPRAMQTNRWTSRYSTVELQRGNLRNNYGRSITLASLSCSIAPPQWRSSSHYNNSQFSVSATNNSHLD